MNEKETFLRRLGYRKSIYGYFWYAYELGNSLFCEISFYYDKMLVEFRYYSPFYRKNKVFRRPFNMTKENIIKVHTILENFAKKNNVQ